MRLISRKRRMARWVGLGLCVLIAGSWALSQVHVILFTVGGVGLELDAGWFTLFLEPPMSTLFGSDAGQPIAFTRRAGSSFTTEHYFGRDSWGDPYAEFPVWMILLPVTIATALAWCWPWGRPQPGHCVRCGYNLHKNTSGVCPECGLKIAEQQAVTAAKG